MNHSILIDYNFKNFKEFKVLLVLQSSPTNPWAQLQEKELTPSTQTPSFLQGLDRQSFISENVYLIKWSLLELYHQYAIMKKSLILLYWKQSLFTYLTFFSSIPLRTYTSIWTNTINARSVIFTWRGFTFVNI